MLTFPLLFKFGLALNSDYLVARGSFRGIGVRNLSEHSNMIYCSIIE